MKHPSARQEIKLEAPNIVFINIDSLRADHMGVYGYNKNTTPFLDSLFKKGVIFKNAIAPAPFTFQDDAAIFSGIYPSQNNITDWVKIINKKIDLLPKILSYYGYNTAAFVSPSLYESFEMNKSFDDYIMNPEKNIDEVKFSLSNKLKQTESPFFVFWHIYDVHLPYYSASEEFYPKEYKGSLLPISKYFAKQNELMMPTQKLWSNQTKDGLCDNFSNSLLTCERYVKITPEDKEYIIASYDTGVKYVDKQLYYFFDSIKNEPFFENTLFIISAEHGEDLGDHKLFFHGDIYNVNIHVPLVFIHPKLKPLEIKGAVSTVDIMPTIFSLMGIPKNEKAEGEDLSPLFNGENYKERPIFSERAPFNEYSAIMGNWKYIMRDPLKLDPEEYNNKITPFMLTVLKSDCKESVKDELYDLSNDPYEQNNLIGKGYEQEEELANLVRGFKEKMIRFREMQEVNQSLPLQSIIQYP